MIITAVGLAHSFARRPIVCEYFYLVIFLIIYAIHVMLSFSLTRA